MKTIIGIFALFLALTFVNVNSAEATTSLNYKFKTGIKKKKNKRHSAKKPRKVDVSRCPYKKAYSKVNLL
jgi:hypothetical protein